MMVVVIYNEMPPISLGISWEKSVEFLLQEDCMAWFSDAARTTPDTPDICPPSLLLSRLLGWIVVIVGVCLKLPLLRSLLSGSNEVKLLTATSIPIISLCLEIGSLLIGLSFNYRLGIPFSAYGECIFLLLQDVMIVTVSIFLRTGNYPRSMSVPLIVSIALTVLLSSHVDHLHTLLSLNIPLIFMTMLPPILQNYRNKHTVGFPLSMVLLGQGMGFTRMFTTFMEVPRLDWTLALGSSLGPALNIILLLEVFLYQQETDRLLHAKAKHFTPKAK